MKKIISAFMISVLSLALTLGFCACGEKDDGKTENGDTFQTDDKNEGDTLTDLKDKMQDDLTDKKDENK